MKIILIRMDENEIDKTYIDELFIIDINSIDIDRYSSLISFIIEYYSEEITNDKLAYITNIISSIFGHDINSTSIYRKLKYLINKGIYNRFTKKYKLDLINLGLDENKIDEIINIAKESPSLGELYKSTKSNTNILKDVQITTNVPIYSSNYSINQDGSDIKKQKLLIKFDYSSDTSSLIEINKNQLFTFYQEIEKIQEKLDKLY
jgi:hypothetical protein